MCEFFALDLLRLHPLVMGIKFMPIILTNALIFYCSTADTEYQSVNKADSTSLRIYSYNKCTLCLKYLRNHSDIFRVEGGINCKNGGKLHHAQSA